MHFQTPLIPATLIQRYKRFLADCRLTDGTTITAHCANPGSMMGLAEPGSRVWLEPNADPRKKLKFGWRLVEIDGAMVCVDTGLANKVVGEALAAHRIPGLPDYDTVRPETRYGEKSRVDFLLTSDLGGKTYLEVKSVTLSRQTGLAEFPDSVTARGARHLDDLAEMVRQGHNAAMLFLIQRTDCKNFSVASDIDAAYSEAFGRAKAAGVTMLAHASQITPQTVAFHADPIAVT